MDISRWAAGPLSRLRDRRRFAAMLALPLLSGLSASVSHAQLTYFVNAESGATNFNGLTSLTPWPSLRFALGQLNLPANLPAPGTFHTLMVAGRYDGSGNLLVHDQVRENWAAGPIAMPPYIQVLYDAANSDNIPGLGGFAPVVIDGGGVGTPLFLFNARDNEPTSRFDGTNSLVPPPPVVAPWQSNYFVARNAATVFEIRPPAPTPEPLPVAAIPPGASFQRIRFENVATGLSVLAGGTSFAAGSVPHLFSPVVHQCLFVAGAAPARVLGRSRCAREPSIR